MKLVDALRFRGWDLDTAAPGCEQAGEGKPHGQCAVTALVVQDALGGALLRADVDLRDAGGYTSHYWNLIPAVGEVDLTREQFHQDQPIPRGVEVPRSRLLEGERAMDARTPQRYELLRGRLVEAGVLERPAPPPRAVPCPTCGVTVLVSARAGCFWCCGGFWPVDWQEKQHKRDRLRAALGRGFGGNEP